MTTNSNFRVKNGLEVAEQAVIDGITLSNSSGTFAATINQTIVNSSTIALITSISSSTVVDAMNSYTGDSISVSGSPTYSTTQTKFDDYSWNNENTDNNYIEAYSGGGYDFSSMGSADNWTIDMWIYTKSGASDSGNQTLVNGSLFGDGPNNIWFGVDSNTPLSGTLKAGNADDGYTSGPTMPGTEAWHHVGVMRKSGVLYFLLNGTTTAVSGNPTLAFGAGLEFLGGSNENSFGLGYASRIRVAPATALFAVGTYTLPVEADYDPAGSISETSNALIVDYNGLANKPTLPNQALDTDDNVQFSTVQADNGISTPLVGDTAGDINSGTYLELGKSANDYTLISINANYADFWSNSQVTQHARIDSNGLKLYVGHIEFADNTTATTANGLSGYSGISGYSGAEGASGYSGVAGEQGVQGDSGISGYSGVAGAEGASGYSGVAGAEGASGYSGVAGATGETGISGYSGAVGTSGYSGYSGPGANQALNTDSSVTFANIDLKKFDEQVYNWGTVSTGTVWIDVNSGTIHRMTLGGNITMNAFTGTVVTGTSVTVVLKQDATGSRTLTSTMKFAGGSKTLSTAGTTTDVISVFYDGVDYLAALTKGFV
jgi:hypothetical protein